jgi:hypothetical protein
VVLFWGLGLLGYGVWGCFVFCGIPLLSSGFWRLAVAFG